MLYRKGNRWALCPFKVRYIQHDEEIEQYSHDKDWWLNFEERWDHTEIVEFIDVEYTDQQLDRFKDIEFMPEDFGHVYSEYVKTGTFIDDLPKDHSFDLIKMRYENELQGVELSQREINEIMHGIQLSDLEIRMIMGGL